LKNPLLLPGPLESQYQVPDFSSFQLNRPARSIKIRHGALPTNLCFRTRPHSK
jgi:hypothetical protein